MVDPSVPDGVDQVIDAIDAAGVVLDPSNNVVKASQAALAFGLVSNQGLVRPELVDMVDSVRRTGEPVSRDISLSRGPFGDATIHLQVRVARLGTSVICCCSPTIAPRLTGSKNVRRDFIANISHELKTPIGAISLLAEALEPASDDPQQVRKFAKRLETEAQRLSRITREIIELSRLQASDVLTSADLVDVDTVVANAIDQNHVQVDARMVTIVSGGEKGAQVFGDEGLLVLALHNLIANAVQYSGEGTRVGVGVRVQRGYRRDRRHRSGRRHSRR